MVEVSRDGRRIYFTNSLYGAIDPDFYPDGVKSRARLSGSTPRTAAASSSIPTSSSRGRTATCRTRCEAAMRPPIRTATHEVQWEIARNSLHNVELKLDWLRGRRSRVNEGVS
jgi:56kDa selenium binding protein (SBP56)